MRKDAESHAADDEKRRGMVEAKNQADSAIYTSEKAVKDLGDKVPADLKKQVEDAIAKVRKSLEGDDADAINKATEELMTVVQQLGAAAYQAGGATPGGDVPPAGGNDEDVVDGEFTDAD
jgi:molecular chaperone DnaK